MNTPYKFDHTFSDLAKFDKFFVGSDKFLQKVQETMAYAANSAASAGYRCRPPAAALAARASWRAGFRRYCRHRQDCSAPAPGHRAASSPIWH